MAKRVYLVPAVGSGATIDDARRAAYVYQHFDGLVFSTRDYGDEPVFLVEADAGDKQHDALMAEPDVIALPDDPKAPIDRTLEEALKTLKLPTNAASAADLPVALHKLFSVLQRCQEAGVNPISGKAIDAPVDDATVAKFAEAGAVVPKGQTIGDALLGLAAALPGDAVEDGAKR